MEQVIGRGVVGDEEVDSAVAVAIERNDAQSPPFSFEETGLFGHIDELARIVAKNVVRKGLEEARVTIVVFVRAGTRAKRRVHLIPLEVMADIKVEVSIIVEVGPCRGGGPVAIAPESGRGGRVLEAAPAQVVIKGIRPPAGDEQIGTTVVIEVADGDTLAVTAGEPGQSGRVGHVYEAAVAPVAEESVVERSRTRRRRKLSPLNGVDVEPAVAIEVQECDTAAHGLWELTLGRAPVVESEDEAPRLSLFNESGNNRCA